MTTEPKRDLFGDFLHRLRTGKALSLKFLEQTTGLGFLRLKGFEDRTPEVSRFACEDISKALRLSPEEAEILGYLARSRELTPAARAVLPTVLKLLVGNETTETIPAEGQESTVNPIATSQADDGAVM